MFKSAKVTTISGHSWTTPINGSYQEIIEYFMGKRFDIGVYPIERLERVIKVDVFGTNGTKEEEPPQIVMLFYKPTGSVTYGVMFSSGMYATFRDRVQAEKCIQDTSIEFIQLYALSNAGMTFLNSDYEVTAIN